MSFCFLYNVVSENHSVQNSPWGGGEGVYCQLKVYKYRHKYNTCIKNSKSKAEDTQQKRNDVFYRFLLVTLNLTFGKRLANVYVLCRHIFYV